MHTQPRLIRQRSPADFSWRPAEIGAFAHAERGRFRLGRTEREESGRTRSYGRSGYELLSKEIRILPALSGSNQASSQDRLRTLSSSRRATFLKLPNSFSNGWPKAAAKLGDAGQGEQRSEGRQGR